MATARQVVFPQPRKATIEERPVQSPGPGQVLIATQCTLISTGTELTAYSGDFREESRWARYVQYPWLPGYSNVGVIVEVGAGVGDLHEGQRVVSHGSHASLVVQDVAQVYPLPDNVSAEEAAFCTLGVISLNGVRLCGIQLGESVVIFGVGLVGQLATIFARMNGAWPLVAIDLARSRLEMARRNGATHLLPGEADDLIEQVSAITKGRMADVVLEVTGNPSVIPAALRLARRLGRVVLLGSPRGETVVDFHDEVHTLGLHIIGAHNSTHPAVETPYNVWTHHRDRELFLGLLSAGEISMRHMITHRFPWRDAPRAFDMLLEDRTQAMGVILDWTE